MTTLNGIQQFLAQKNIAIAGVSRNSKKFGNAVFKELKTKGYNLYPVNPHMEELDGHPCYHDIESLPGEVSGLFICTQPEVSKSLVEKARKKGIENIWLQQGAADKEFLKTLENGRQNLISRQCILMFADPVKGVHGFHRWLKKNFGKFPA